MTDAIFSRVLEIAEGRGLGYPLYLLFRSKEGGERMYMFAARGEAPACISLSPALRSPIAVRIHGPDAGRAVHATLQFRIDDSGVEMELGTPWESEK
jgi:hypothetical protein